MKLHHHFVVEKMLKNFLTVLHLIVVFQPRGKKEDLTGEDEIPQFIEKKIKSA